MHFLHAARALILTLIISFDFDIVRDIKIFYRIFSYFRDNYDISVNYRYLSRLHVYYTYLFI